jgi:hypothetical protein
MRIVISSCAFYTACQYQYDNHASNGAYSPRSGLEALGNIGDFLGGVGVLVTLHLASQIRQNSHTGRNAAAESVLQTMISALQTASSSPQISRVIAVGQTNIEDLSEDERAQFLF